MNQSSKNSTPVYWMSTLSISIPNFQKENLIKYCKLKYTPKTFFTQFLVSQCIKK